MGGTTHKRALLSALLDACSAFSIATSCLLIGLQNDGGEAGPSWCTTSCTRCWYVSSVSADKLQATRRALVSEMANKHL
jgi:hypothetical protein